MDNAFIGNRSAKARVVHSLDVSMVACGGASYTLIV